MTCVSVTHCPKERWPWRLEREILIETGIWGFLADQPLYRMKAQGSLVVRPGYAWDGASGPAVDTASWIRGSCVHDCLYQMIREHHLTPQNRVNADRLMRQILLEDGMHPVRAWWSWLAVRLFGRRAVR